MFQPFPYDGFFEERLQHPDLSGYEEDLLKLNTNPRNCLEIFHTNPWAFNTDSPATVSAFPHVGSATIEGNWVVANFGEVTGYIVRGWQGHVAATDGI